MLFSTVLQFPPYIIYERGESGPRHLAIGMISNEKFLSIIQEQWPAPSQRNDRIFLGIIPRISNNFCHTNTTEMSILIYQ